MVATDQLHCARAALACPQAGRSGHHCHARAWCQGSNRTSPAGPCPAVPFCAVLCSPSKPFDSMNGIAMHAVACRALTALCCAVPRSPGKPFDSMNGIAATLLLNTTSSVRFEGSLNVDLNDITMNLVPFPRMHFLVSAMSPMAAPKDVAKLAAPRTLDQVGAPTWRVQPRVVLRGGCCLCCGRTVCGCGGCGCDGYDVCCVVVAATAVVVASQCMLDRLLCIL